MTCAAAAAPAGIGSAVRDAAVATSNLSQHPSSLLFATGGSDATIAFWHVAHPSDGDLGAISPVGRISTAQCVPTAMTWLPRIGSERSGGSSGDAMEDAGVPSGLTGGGSSERLLAVGFEDGACVVFSVQLLSGATSLLATIVAVLPSHTAAVCAIAVALHPVPPAESVDAAPAVVERLRDVRLDSILFVSGGDDGHIHRSLLLQQLPSGGGGGVDMLAAATSAPPPMRVRPLPPTPQHTDFVRALVLLPGVGCPTPAHGAQSFRGPSLLSGSWDHSIRLQS